VIIAMLALSPVHAATTVRLYLYTKDVDMRRSFDGLLGIVQAEFACDIRCGDTFLFLNKRRDRIKILWWDGDGLAIFMKRLEAGTYQRPVVAEDQVSLLMDRTQVELLLSGIDLTSVKRRKRYQITAPTSALHDTAAPASLLTS
jgi:transposase